MGVCFFSGEEVDILFWDVRHGVTLLARFGKLDPKRWC
jgi:hypothetical protein